MATRYCLPRSERITLDSSGRFTITPATLARWQHDVGPTVDVAAEVARAEVWFADKMRNKSGNQATFLWSWLRRAAKEASLQPPRLSVVRGGMRGDGVGRAVLELVAQHGN